MKTKLQLLLALLCCIATLQLSAQKDYNLLFKKAYQTYPDIPYPALEVLSYAQTRISNVQFDADMDHHHGPTHYGIFGLVEDGENYFKNTLYEISKFSGIAIEKIKSDDAAQMNAVAFVLNAKCRAAKVSTVAELSTILTHFFEAPDASKIDAFAKDQFLYEIYQSLQNGFTANGVTVLPVKFESANWFSADNFKVLSSKQVFINNEHITNGTDEYKAVNNQNNIITPTNTSTARDYTGALWVASPNYSSRAGTAISAVAIHTMQGSYAGSISWFQNTGSSASAHYMIRSSDGQITQMVLEANKAWHAGTANPYTVGIEHEGYVNNASWYTTAMYTASANLTKNICSRNGIDPTTCYNGVAHSTVVVLSTAIKIKGHQHFSSQTHTDPGINWNWSLYYGLINPPTCNATTVLNESYIGTNAANLNWSAVSGAASYTVQWKTSSGTTWSSINSVNNYYTITGLSASTAYNWRIVTNCSAGTSTSTSATQTFTTQASCYDAYENNNSYLAPTTYPALNGSFVYAKICGTGDADFFKVTTTAASNINISLSNLSKNYNIETFTTAGAYLQGAYTTGTTSEALTMNNKPAGSYLVKIYGFSSTEHDALNDYRLKITTSAPTAREANTNDEETISLVPNPAKANTTLLYRSIATEKVIITIKDVYGITKYQNTYFATEGLQKINLNVVTFKEGFYIVQISNKQGIVASKQLLIQ